MTQRFLYLTTSFINLDWQEEKTEESGDKSNDNEQELELQDGNDELGSELPGAAVKSFGNRLNSVCRAKSVKGEFY